MLVKTLGAAILCGTMSVEAAADGYIKKNNVKLQLDYSRAHRQRGTGVPANDQLFRFQVQLMM